MPKKQKRNLNKGLEKTHQSNESDEHEVTDEAAEKEEEKKYNKRSIKSNWEKYEIEIPPDTKEEESTSSANDFDYLVKNVNTSSHSFRFKAEQNWEKEITEKKPFQLNINLQALSAGLACIPFYDRIGLDKNEFSEEEVKRFDDLAEKSWKSYEKTRDDYFKLDENLEKWTKHYEEKLRLHEENEEKELLRKKFLAQFSRRSKTVNRKICEINLAEAEKERKKDNEVALCVGDKITEQTLNVKESDILGDLNEQLEKIDIVSVEKQVNDVDETGKTSEIKSLSKDENLEDWLDSVLDS